jgi:hypothetical protein
MTTWRKELTSKLNELGMKWGDLIACTLDESELDFEFDDCCDPRPLLVAWSADLVFFPMISYQDSYEGGELYCDIGFIPRDPCDSLKSHLPSDWHHYGLDKS